MPNDQDTRVIAPAGPHLRWVPLAEAVAQAGRDARQLQRWAAETKSWVRRRRRGRTVEYCLDDVLAVVGRAPAQQRITQQHRRIAELERALAATEGMLADARAQVRRRRIAFDGVRAKHKARLAARDAQIAALYTLITTLQDEIIRLRLARKSWWRQIRRRW